jgi:hypothetical protein
MKPYTFEVMTPQGMTISPVTVLARTWIEAAEIASAKVRERGETVLDVQDGIVVIPDE